MSDRRETFIAYIGLSILVIVAIVVVVVISCKSKRSGDAGDNQEVSEDTPSEETPAPPEV